MRRKVWLCIAALLAGVAAACDAPDRQSKPEASPQGRAGQVLPVAPGKFDFYVLALSWSPSYCAAEGAAANRQQCASGRDHAFVVHGLWPQFEGGFPTDCAVDRDRVPDDIARSLSDLMPSAGLVGYQWRRHGSCTGLGQKDYFTTLRAARERVVIPPDYRSLAGYETVSAGAVEQSFRRANPGLGENAISVQCDQRLLREVRVCMTRELQFRPCPQLEKRACRANKLVMPPVRG